MRLFSPQVHALVQQAHQLLSAQPREHRLSEVGRRQARHLSCALAALRPAPDPRSKVMYPEVSNEADVLTRGKLGPFRAEA
ncbi:hypothetical protein, partial [Streptomyces graminilatus]|uniref:hypothetical protein n=1 Tax=Streptomyces graminilatus TaxID=1464070 RepID=UPI0019D70C94